MTTESKQDTRQVHPAGVSPLLVASVAGAAAVAALSVVAALVDGERGIAGAAAGGVLTLVVFLLGVGLVNVTARVLPAASLLVALLTYTLQLLVLALAAVALERGGVADEDLSRGWFAASVIAGTVLWLVGQVIATTRQRIPAFDVATGDHPGGER